MVNKYRNIYWIVVYDWSDLVDNWIHDSIRQLVNQSELWRFELRLYGDLNHNDTGFELLK